MATNVYQISEERLERDVVYRVDFLRKFMGFSDEDIALIQDAGPVLAPRVPEIVDAVYHRLFAFDLTRRHFVARQHGYEGAVPTSDSDLNADHEQVKFRKMHLQAYFVKLVSQPFDSKMLLFLDWVGRIHTAQAGNPAIYVPMVQVNALFGFVHDALTIVLQGAHLPQPRRDGMVRAFSKLLWIQADLFMRHYQAQDPE